MTDIKKKNGKKAGLIFSILAFGLIFLAGRNAWAGSGSFISQTLKEQSAKQGKGHGGGHGGGRPPRAQAVQKPNHNRPGGGSQHVANNRPRGGGQHVANNRPGSGHSAPHRPHVNRPQAHKPRPGGNHHYANNHHNRPPRVHHKPKPQYHRPKPLVHHKPVTHRPAPRYYGKPRHRHYPVHHSRHPRHYRTMPRGYFSISFGGIPYFYYSGVFYQRGSSGFFLVGAPIGAVVHSLPVGYTRVVYSNTYYYCYDDVYYRKVPSGYQVVDSPITPVAVAAPAFDRGDWVRVTAPNLNVRTGPGYDFPIKEVAPQYCQLEVMGGSTGGWVYVRISGENFGWVSTAYVELLNTQPLG